ncbi:MAG: hypothetical protein LC713_07940 [Actinobacteria bacterium]|nr:hypothetical protein [Actinomycetota bacterium]
MITELECEQYHTRQLLHLDTPVVSAAATPQLAAAEYLHAFADLLGLRASQLGHLGLSPEARPTDSPLEYRFLGEKRRLDAATVAYHPAWSSKSSRPRPTASPTRRAPAP